METAKAPGNIDSTEASSPQETSPVGIEPVNLAAPQSPAPEDSLELRIQVQI